MGAIKHARISRAKGLYRYRTSVYTFMYLHVYLVTSKRLIEKTYIFVDSFEARHTEPLCRWYMGIWGIDDIPCQLAHTRR